MSVNSVTGINPVSDFLSNINPAIGNFWTPNEITIVSESIYHIGDKFNGVGSDINNIFENALSKPIERLINPKKNC
jgi:hypothetical protein